jgi:hypothetical protein
MIDEAFLPFHEIIGQMLSFSGDLVDEKAGVRSRIYECSIESPVEMDIVAEADGTVRIGSIPPLYRVDTTFRPAYHAVRFTAVRVEDDDGR